MTNINESKRPVLQNNAQIRHVTLVALVCNIALSILKFIVGNIGHSQAVIADAVHSLSDMSTDLAILFGVKYWSAPADDEHPYGHQRIETLVTLFIGVILLIVAFEIGRDAILTIRDRHITAPTWIAFSGAFVSIIVKEILYRWNIAVGRRLKSSALIANAWHHRTDAFSSLPAAIAVAIAAIFPNLAFVDHIGAIVVAVIIFKVAWNIMRSTITDLMDVAVSEKEQNHIRLLAMQVPGVADAHEIRTRKMGTNVCVDLHIWVDGNMTVSRGHDISEQVAERILANAPDVIDVVVHLEPRTEEPDKMN